jgi:hypothetical protein
VATRKILVEAQFVDSTKAGLADLQRRLATLEQRMQGAAKGANQAQTQFKGLVSEKLGRRMVAFNEKTERARSLLLLLGPSIGGVAGQAVYLSGTIGAVVGGFTRMQLLLVGLIGSVFAAGAAIKKGLNVELEATKKRQDELIKSTDALISELESKAKEREKQLLGAEEFDRRRTQRQRQFVEDELREAQRAARLAAAQAKKAGEDFSILGDALFMVFGPSVKDANNQVAALTQRLASLETAARDAKDELEKMPLADVDNTEGRKRVLERAKQRKIERDQRKKDAQAFAQAQLDMIAAEDAAIEKLEQNAEITKALRDVDARDSLKKVMQLQMLRDVETDIVKQKQLDIQIEQAIFEDQQALNEAKIQAEIDTEAAKTEARKKAKDKRKEMADEEIKLAKEEAKIKNQIFQQGASQLIGFIQAAEQGRLRELAKSSAWQALQQWAYYFGAQAFGLTAQAERHLASAALHTAFAAAAGIGSLAQSGGGGGSASNDSTITSATGSGGVQSSEQAQEQNVVYIGNFFESEDANRELAARVDAANTRDSFRGL